MGLFDDVLKGGESLIRSEEALDYDYLPKLLPYREKEQRHFASCIKPILQKRSGRNLLVFGAPGIGKTAAVRFVLRDLEEESDTVHAVYVNCWQRNSTYKVLLDICEQVGYKFTQNKKTTDLFDVIVRIVNKSGAVFVFDEIDKAEDLDFLYFVLEEVYHKAVFLITNYKGWLVDLDERIKSRLTPELVEFKAYSEAETRGILKERMEYAFPPGVWADDALELVVKKTALLKDIRSGLFLMREAALQAEEKSKKKIERADVEKAIAKLDDFTIKNSTELAIDEQIILSVVKEHSGSRIGDLYKHYQAKGGAGSYKTFQRKIKKLEEGKFVDVTKVAGGTEGNTTIVNKKLTEF
ncbi:MAG: AAA family ATPase [Candidatus Altiarchaeota archaeon]|nr:AAA family ATPase [Candidatus Altiarchaeota archaeon]